MSKLTYRIKTQVFTQYSIEKEKILPFLNEHGIDNDYKQNSTHSDKAIDKRKNLSLSL